MRMLVAVVVVLLGLHVSAQDGPLRLAVIGIEHGHVEGALWNAMNRDDIELVGVSGRDRALFDRFAEKYGLDESLFYADAGEMLDATKPEAASVMTRTSEHLWAVTLCAPRGVHAMVEKPLDFDADRARAMADVAADAGILLLTNYETSWYRSVRTAKTMMVDEGSGPIRRAVFRHGHQGPVAIGCSLTFYGWLTNPAANGGGAITDFGCYGAAIMTWLRGGELPISVTATTRTLQPDLYGGVDDDATIVLTYPDATAVIQASWAWTHDLKEMDLYSEQASLHAGKWDELHLREPDGPLEQVTTLEDAPGGGGEWAYLKAVVRGEAEVDPLSGIEVNLAVAEILDAARESARTGRAVELE
ncbi:MAG: Gfo/Idh/MocA family oxidoreductase [Planctomycetota bacterium]